MKMSGFGNIGRFIGISVSEISGEEKKIGRFMVVRKSRILSRRMEIGRNMGIGARKIFFVKNEIVGALRLGQTEKCPEAPKSAGAWGLAV